MPKTTCMVFVESELDKRNRLYKKVKDLGYAAEMTRQNGKQLAAWAGGILAKEGKKITAHTMELFLSKTGDDMENIRMELEKLISYACDGVAVMNYNRRDEYGQMAMEVGFAREYGKEILCIYELQKPGKHELEEINTYANEGLKALWKSRERLEKQFGYDKLGFAYHYYKPLKEMLEGENP